MDAIVKLTKGNNVMYIKCLSQAPSMADAFFDCADRDGWVFVPSYAKTSTNFPSFCLATEDFITFAGIVSGKVVAIEELVKSQRVINACWGQYDLY